MKRPAYVVSAGDLNPPIEPGATLGVLGADGWTDGDLRSANQGVSPVRLDTPSALADFARLFSDAELRVKLSETQAVFWSKGLALSSSTVPDDELDYDGPSLPFLEP